MKLEEFFDARREVMLSTQYPYTNKTEELSILTVSVTALIERMETDKEEQVYEEDLERKVYWILYG